MPVHDLHPSIALGNALAFHRLRDNFAGKVRLFFDPAVGRTARRTHGEDGEGGKLLDGFDRALGFHISPEIPAKYLGGALAP